MHRDLQAAKAVLTGAIIKGKDSTYEEFLATLDRAPWR